MVVSTGATRSEPPVASHAPAGGADAKSRSKSANVVTAEDAPAEASAIPRQAVGAAVSKLISASIGEIAVIFSRSPAHKHHTFADLEWMVLPAVVTGQVYVAEMMHTQNGARAPVAAVLWASVSKETDKRLSDSPRQRPKLRPDEWKAGGQLWIIDLAGETAAVASSLKHLAANDFGDKNVKMLMRDPDSGAARVTWLRDMLASAVATATTGGRGHEDIGANS